VKITHEALPSGSYLLRGFLDGHTPGESDIDLVVVLTDKGEGVCSLVAAKGDMTDDGNLALGWKAYELGFKRIEFCALKGKPVTRWAKQVGTGPVYDFYTVDLESAIAQLDE